MENKERQTKLYNIIYICSLDAQKVSIEEIYNMMGDAYNREHPRDPKIYDDVEEINNSLEYPFIICVRGKKFWVGTKEETDAYIRNLYNKALSLIARARILIFKMGLNDTKTIYDEDIKSYLGESNENVEE